MTMNKREREYVSSLEQRLRIAYALRWSEQQTGPDIPAPAPGSSARTAGWTYNSYTRKVEKAWSTSITHGEGGFSREETHGSARQGSKALYSTKELALRALRNAVELQAAVHLEEIDEQIENEMTGALLGGGV